MNLYAVAIGVRHNCFDVLSVAADCRHLSDADESHRRSNKLLTTLRQGAAQKFKELFSLSYSAVQYSSEIRITTIVEGVLKGIKTGQNGQARLCRIC